MTQKILLEGLRKLYRQTLSCQCQMSYRVCLWISMRRLLSTLKRRYIGHVVTTIIGKPLKDKINSKKIWSAIEMVQRDSSCSEFSICQWIVVDVSYKIPRKGCLVEHPTATQSFLKILIFRGFSIVVAFHWSPSHKLS